MQDSNLQQNLNQWQQGLLLIFMFCAVFGASLFLDSDPTGAISPSEKPTHISKAPGFSQLYNNVKKPAVSAASLVGN